MSNEKAGRAERQTCAHDDPTQPEPFVTVTVSLRASTLTQVEALRAQPRAVEVSREQLLRALVITGLAYWEPSSSSSSDDKGAVSLPRAGGAP